jgi:tetratricopeptide (TPR) repeat protein
MRNRAQESPSQRQITLSNHRAFKPSGTLETSAPQLSRRMSPTTPRQGTLPPDEDRLLDSWKEISAYLGRSVRTVQIWEKEEGLPVHRHQHRKGPTVYANASEIDAWRKGRDGDDEAAVRSGSGRWLLASVGAILLAVLGTVWWALDRTNAADPPAFAERDWLLIADFDNQTGESLLDGTLEAALRREIVNSLFLNVVPRERVADTLQLMDKPLNAELDAALAHEVAVRDGGIRAIVSGEVTKLGSSYLLSAEVTNSADGVAVASLSEEAQEEKDLLLAMERLAVQVRSALGETLSIPQEAGSALRRVSTSSLRALQLYSQADELLLAENLGGPDRNEAAAVLLREAIAEDPGFASAHLLLAFAVLRQGKTPEEFLPHAERALDLVDTTTERESYFIRASSLSLKQDNEAAIPFYRALIERHPDHFWAHQSLRTVLTRLGRYREAHQATTALVSLRPNNFQLSIELAIDTIATQGLEAALPYVERARSLIRPESLDASRQWTYVWLETIPAWEHWLRGDLESMAAEVERLEQLIEEAPAGPRREQLIYQIEGPDRVLGRLARAERWAAMETDDHTRWQENLQHFYTRGDMEGIGRWLDRYMADLDPDWNWTPTLVPPLLAQLGRLDTFEALVESGLLFMPEMAKAYFDLAEGNPEEAIRGFEATIPKIANRNSRYFLASQSLSEAYRQLGDLEKARLILEEASSQRSQSVATGSGAWWLMHQVHLADFYREQGMIPEAQTVEAEVLALLALADADHPLLVKLQARMGSRL